MNCAAPRGPRRIAVRDSWGMGRARELPVGMNCLTARYACGREGIYIISHANRGDCLKNAFVPLTTEDIVEIFKNCL